MKQKLSVVGANLVFAAIVTGYFVFEIILVILRILLERVYGSEFVKFTVMDNLYYTTLAQFILLLFPVLFYSFARNNDILKVFRLNKLKFSHIVIVALVSIPACFAAKALNTINLYMLQPFVDIPEVYLPVPGNISELLVVIFTIAVTPAICEEFLFRGLMLSSYEIRGSMRAVVITSIMFAIYHFDITNVAGTIFSGILFGYMVLRTNSLYSAVIAHFINNTIAELLIYRSGIEYPVPVVVSVLDFKYSLYYLLVSLFLIFFLMKLLVKVTQGVYTPKPPIARIRDDFISVLSHWPIILVLFLYIATIHIFY
ncbi:MAG TPA: CPBP family intramembrane metalloprotease [Clostridiaceae bacterium]|nr:CPBP family intramembrane metalloprotease [Clostridiaceae bacterium]